MEIKEFNKDESIESLEALKTVYPEKTAVIETELRKLRSGAAEEANVAHYLDRDIGRSRNSIILHGLRIEFKGQVFQIDHLIVSRALIFTLLETKSAKHGLKVDARGNFYRMFKGKPVGMPSPVEQVESQARLLQEFLQTMEILPKRLGVSLRPVLRSYVTLSPSVKFECATDYDDAKIIRYDQILKINDDAENDINVVGRLLNFVSYETLEEIGKRLMAQHTPHSIDWVGKLKLGQSTQKLETPISADAGNKVDHHVCKKCGADKLEIKHGYGYYFRCFACGEATKISLPGPGKLKKQGVEFFYVEEGKPDVLFHRNV